MNANAKRVMYGLSNSQIRWDYRYKNLWWQLNGDMIGYGDLNDDDILRIAEKLAEPEEFIGWNEHHLSDWHQTDRPMIIIRRDDIIFRPEIVAAA